MQPIDQTFEAIEVLQEWGQNFESSKSPFSLFLDLINFSEENYGCRLTDMNEAIFGHIELDMLGAALSLYATRPNDVISYLESGDDLQK